MYASTVIGELPENGSGECEISISVLRPICEIVEVDEFAGEEDEDTVIFGFRRCKRNDGYRQKSRGEFSAAPRGLFYFYLRLPRRCTASC